MRSTRRPSGRYDGARARVPGGTLVRPPASPSVQPVVGNIANPFDASDRIAVYINRKTDLLEAERHLHAKTQGNSGLDEAAYLTGRLIQRAFEVSVKSGSNWIEGGGGPDSSGKVAHLMERAEKLWALERDIRKAVGQAGVDMIRRILGDGWSYGEIAHREGRPGDRGLRAVASRFRWIMSEIVEYRSRTGRTAGCSRTAQ